MTPIPHAVPQIDDPRIAHALASRWRRTRTLLLLSAGLLPAATGLICVALAGIAPVWWAAIPAVTAVACAGVLLTWLRRNGLNDPYSWLPATVLMTGTQLVLGVLPGSAIALRLTPHAALAVKALCALGMLSAGSSGVLARMARRTLLDSPLLELGSTGFPLVLAGPAHVVIGNDRIDWKGARVSFDRIGHVSTEASGLVLHTASGAWTVPVADPAAAHALLRRRLAWWEEQRLVAAEHERRHYLDLVASLAEISGVGMRGGVGVTVDSNGVTTGIALSPAVRDLDPDVLAARLMDCAERARSDARRQV
ncbi:hypothetical protein UK23_22105, partial [Lentzea aerocolonigenes]